MNTGVLSIPAAAKSLQSCPTLCDAATRLPCPWDSPCKNTGVGCHFLLQCLKVKSESEVAQSCPTLRDPMDCSLPGSSIHAIFQARVLEGGAIAFSTHTAPLTLFLFFFFSFCCKDFRKMALHIWGKSSLIWATQETCRQNTKLDSSADL